MHSAPSLWGTSTGSVLHLAAADEPGIFLPGTFSALAAKPFLVHCQYGVAEIYKNLPDRGTNSPGTLA